MQHINPEFNYHKKNLNRQLQQRLTGFGKRLNEGFGHTLTPMCFGGLGGGGGCIRAPVPSEARTGWN